MSTGSGQQVYDEDVAKDSPGQYRMEAEAASETVSAMDRMLINWVGLEVSGEIAAILEELDNEQLLKLVVACMSLRQMHA